MFSDKHNMRKFTVLVFGLIILTSVASIGQEAGYKYTKEIRWGINKNTSSGLIGGIIIRYSIAQNDWIFQTFGVELMNILHHNEYRLTSRKTGSFFKLAKQNYFYSLRMQYGKDFTLFKKAPQQGVQVVAMLSGGPSLGFQSPYYLNVNGESVPYSPTNNDHRDLNKISGSGKVFQGLGESKIILGANIKLGMSFEFGVFKNGVTGFEVGFLVDAYTKKVIITDELKSKNHAVFPTSFITIFWGSRK